MSATPKIIEEVEIVERDGVKYEYTKCYKLFEDGKKKLLGTVEVPVIENEPEAFTDPVMEKLNSIETRLNTLTADSMTVESVAGAILEGVNEV